MKPIAYLDVDDTLLMWNNTHPKGHAAPYAREFVLWLKEHFEVRWLTSWAVRGYLLNEHVTQLAQYLNCEEETLSSIVNPRPWWGSKCEGINWDELTEGREFVWIEDALLPSETSELRNRKVYDWFVPMNVSHDQTVLIRAWRKIAERFGFPTPDYVNKSPKGSVQGYSESVESI